MSDKGIWLQGSMPTYGGYRCSNCGFQTVEYKLEKCPKCKMKMYVDYVGYKRIPRWFNEL